MSPLNKIHNLGYTQVLNVGILTFTVIMHNSQEYELRVFTYERKKIKENYFPSSERQTELHDIGGSYEEKICVLINEVCMGICKKIDYLVKVFCQY